MPTAMDLDLDLQEMRGPRERIRRTIPGASLGADDDQYGISDAVTLDLDVRKDGSKCRLVGRLDARLDLWCCRCLVRFHWPVMIDIDLRYLPASENAGDGDVRIEEADLNTAFYRDGQIDLRQLMREQFQLALPMKPLCRDDCRGLCAVCGGNRNAIACECVETWEDPRLAVLKGLLKP